MCAKILETVYSTVLPWCCLPFVQVVLCVLLLVVLCVLLFSYVVCIVEVVLCVLL